QLLCPNSWCVRGDLSPCAGGAGTQCFEHACEQNYPYDAWSVLLAALRQKIARQVTAVALAPSQYLANRLEEHGWQSVRHLPYFTDFVPAPPARRADAALLYVGRLQKEKGIHVLLEAMPEITATIPGARLLLVGSGTEEGALHARARTLGLGPAI